MKLMVVHDSYGNILSVALVSRDVTRAGLKPSNGRQVSLLEVAGEVDDLASLQTHVRLREIARTHKVEVGGQLVKKAATPLRPMS